MKNYSAWIQEEAQQLWAHAVLVFGGDTFQ
jgi:hypothetical protein